MASCSFQLWFQYVDFLKENLIPISALLMTEYNLKIKDRWGESVFRNSLSTPDITKYEEPKTGYNNEKIAQQMRKKEYYQNLEPLNVEDQSMFPKSEIHPIIFEDVYIKEKKADPENIDEDDGFGGGKLLFNNVITIKSKSPKQVHVMVLVHGFQGNSYDMRIFKDNLAVKYPDIIYLCSSSNEDKTEGDIWEMGKRLAEEIRKFVRDWAPDGQCHKISFIGHSLGGLIIRTALIHLQDWSEKFHTFFTLSSPHLGFLYHSSKMVDAGLWFMKAWKKCQSLNQLTLTDAKEVENTFIYQLAMKPGLNQFKNIALISSYQDQYVPWFSARIQKNPKADKSDSNRSKRYQEMVESLLSNLKTDKVNRIDVSFKIPEKNIDSMIGRAAHIQFLENQALMKMFTYCFDNLFS